MFPKLPLLSFSLFYCCNAAVFLWSKNALEISPLSVFTDDTLEDLVSRLGYPEVVVYKTSSSLLPEFERFLDGYHTAYNPNGDLTAENATEISGPEDFSLLETKQRVDLSRNSNVLSVLMVINDRQKRESPDLSSTESPTIPKGPVVYRAKTKEVYSLLYSSQPLLLRYADSPIIQLGESKLVTIDKQSKNSSFRLDAQVPYGEEKYILQFFFTWQNTYWSLTTIKVKSTMSNSSVNLLITEPFLVPAHFSYHCSGVTIYSDVDKSAELQIFDMQVQPDSKNGDFGDVYDCVDFTTVPIWSGLLVTALLGVGLMVALIAISEIKTMDKFDNHKTKQLAITVAE